MLHPKNVIGLIRTLLLRAFTVVVVAALRKAAEFQAKQGKPETAQRLQSPADRLQANYLVVDASRLLQKGRYDEAESVLRRAVAVDQSNVLAHVQLVAALRCTGDLTAAADACTQLVELAPSDEAAAFTHEVLSGVVPKIDQPVEAVWPVSFVRRFDFLPAERHAFLLDYVLERMSLFTRSRVMDELDEDYRSSRVLMSPAEIEAWFVPIIRAAVTDVHPRLQLEPFPFGRVELELTVSHDGDLYKTHVDGSDAKQDHRTTRRLSFVYYFSRRPRPFSGGLLRLYDSSLDGSHSPVLFSAIEPIDNSIIFFRSRSAAHEITKVRCASNDFGDGRFTLNGWIHSADEG